MPDELKKAGNESTKKIFMKHGAKEPYYGVKIEDLKKIQKNIRRNEIIPLLLLYFGCVS